MKVLLLHPPVTYRIPAIYRTESLGLGYVAAVLRRDGHDVEIFDAHLRCLSPSDTVSHLLSRDFDCLGITAADEHKNVLTSILPRIRAKRRDAIIVVGGYLPSLNGDLLLRACPEIDLIITGEGEAVASDVFGRLERGEDWHDAPGVGYLRDGQPVLNPLPPLIEDLDSLPFPARDAMQQVGTKSAGIASSRGCYHRCSFCCIHSFYALSGGRAPRWRSPENVVDEMEHLISGFGVNEFRFLDDDFLGPGSKTRDRVVRIAEEIRARKLDIAFKIECRADEVDLDTLKLLREAGLTDVFLGVESGVQRQLDTYNKRCTVEQNRKAIEMVRQSGVNLRTGYIMFDPYMTIADLEESMRFIRETGIHEEAKRSAAPFVTKMIVHHGVPIVDQLRADGLLRENGIDVDYAFRDPVIGVIWRAALALGACSDLLNRARQFTRRS